VQFLRFVSLYFSITYVFSTGMNSSTPPASTILLITIFAKTKLH